jgi:uncharacterized membrane protein
MILVVGYLISPEAVWDGFLWRFYWAPIEADAQDRPVNGITEAYNVVDTSTYALILVAAVYGIYKFFKKLGLKTGARVVYATVPYILLGGILRALEDASFFPRPSVFLFIAPIIYIFIGLTTFIMLLAANIAERRGGTAGIFSGLTVTGSVIAIIILVYVAIFLTMEPGVKQDNLLHPVLLACMAAIIMMALLAMARRRGRVDSNDQYFGIGIFLLTVATYPAALWFANGGKWMGSQGSGITLMPEQIAIVVLMAVVVTVCISGAGYLAAGKWKWTRTLARPVNMILIFAHMFDAAATYSAIENFGYLEKHVLPGYLIEVTGTPLVMFPLKIIVILVIIYLIDVEIGKDLRRDRILLALVRIAVMVLGMAPGTRDVMRLAMGV